MKKITQICSSALLFLFCGFQLAIAQAPTQSAPIPTRAETDVKSIYSDTYSPISSVTIRINGWGQLCTTEFITLFGNDNMLKITSFDWAPVRISQGIDISDMDSLHIDAYFSNDRSQINTGLMNYYITGVPDVVKYSSNYISHQMGNWVSYNVAITEFIDQGQDCKNINVLRIRGGGEVYLDNIYAYKGVMAGVSDIQTDNSFKIYPTVVADVLNVESIEAIQKTTVFNITGQSVGVFNVKQGKSILDLSYLNSGAYTISTQFSSGRIISKRVVKL